MELLKVDAWRSFDSHESHQNNHYSHFLFAYPEFSL